jgi:hypothetical protein
MIFHGGHALHVDGAEFLSIRFGFGYSDPLTRARARRCRRLPNLKLRRLHARYLVL